MASLLPPRRFMAVVSIGIVPATVGLCHIRSYFLFLSSFRSWTLDLLDRPTLVFLSLFSARH